MPDFVFPASSAGRSPPEAPHYPANLDGIDMAEGLANMGNDPELFHKMLKKAAERYPLLQKQLANAMHMGDRGEVVRILHTLRGLAGTIGAMELQQHASAMEAAWKQTRAPATVPDNLQHAFHAALQRILNTLTILA
ncbi:MAG: Hpt domain-containing protein [Magnetococcales bacterium]|nr:Hpt domain-containing protein [Magnetococcales bacterium]